MANNPTPDIYDLEGKFAVQFTAQLHGDPADGSDEMRTACLAISKALCECFNTCANRAIICEAEATGPILTCSGYVEALEGKRLFEIKTALKIATAKTAAFASFTNVFVRPASVENIKAAEKEAARRHYQGLMCFYDPAERDAILEDRFVAFEACEIDRNQLLAEFSPAEIRRNLRRLEIAERTRNLYESSHTDSPDGVAILEQYAIFDNTPIQEDAPLLSIKGQNCCPRASFILVTGQKKAGKSQFFAWLAASIMGANSPVVTPLTKGARVLYYDTEQKPADTKRLRKRAAQLVRDAGKEWLNGAFVTIRSKDVLKAYPNTLPHLAHKDFITQMASGNFAAIIIDGLVDICPNRDFNDLVGSEQTIGWIDELAQNANIAIIGAIHQNPKRKGDKQATKERGHLGTAAQNHQVEEWELVKDEDRKIFTATLISARAQDSGLSFSWHLEHDYIKIEGTRQETAVETERRQLHNALERVFAGAITLKQSEIIQRLQTDPDFVRLYLSGCKNEKSAKAMAARIIKDKAVSFHKLLTATGTANTYEFTPVYADKIAQEQQSTPPA